MKSMKWVLMTLLALNSFTARAETQCEEDAFRHYQSELDTCSSGDNGSNSYCTCDLEQKDDHFYQQCAQLHASGSSAVELTCFGSRTSSAAQDQADCANFISTYRGCY